MKYLLILATIIAYAVLTQQQETAADATTQASIADVETAKPQQEPKVHLYRYFEPTEEDLDSEFEQVRYPPFFDRLPVQAFPARGGFGGGLNYRYRF